MQILRGHYGTIIRITRISVEIIEIFLETFVIIIMMPKGFQAIDVKAYAHDRNLVFQVTFSLLLLLWGSQ